MSCAHYDMQQSICYKKTRGATRGVSGRRFEILLLMLVYLRCRRTKEQFFLGSSCSEAGKFDDVVVVWKEQDEYYAALVQAKYRKAKSELRLRQLLATQKRNPKQGSYKDYFLGDYHKSYENVKETWKTFHGYRLNSSVFILLTNGTLSKADFRENENKRTNDLDEKITNIFGGILTKLTIEQTQGIVSKDFVNNFRLLSMDLTLKGLQNNVKMEIQQSVSTNSENYQKIYEALRAKIKDWCEDLNSTYLGASSDIWLSVFSGRLEAPSQKVPCTERKLEAPLNNIHCSSYIRRFLTRCQNLLCTFFRRIEDNDICAITGVSFCKFKTLFPDLQSIYRYRNVDRFPDDVRVFCVMSRPRYFFDLCRKYRDRSIHLVKHLKNGRWLWERSCGDVRVARKLLEGHRDRYNEEELMFSSDRALVVESIPGMGISTLLRRMASLWGKNNENDWVMIVDISRCVMSLSSLDIVNVEKVVTILAEGAGNFAVGSLGYEALRDRIQNSGGVALFFDGVADMEFKNYSKFVDLLNFIVHFTRVSKVVVGVRLELTERIEGSVCSVAFRLEPLGETEYNSHFQFLVQHHGAENQYDFMRLRYLETPLLMLAGVKAAVTCGQHVLRWYEELVYHIVATYVMRRSDMKPDQPFLEDMVGAWTRLSRVELLGVVNPKGNLFTDCKYSSKVGLVYSDRKQEKICFTHKGLTEYFNALHLSRNNDELKMLLRNEPYCTVLNEKFDLLNRILCQDCPLHEAIIAGNESEVQTITRNPLRLLSVDSGGRTPLHIAAIYKNFTSARLLSKLAPTTLEVKDESLGWTPFMYANNNSSDPKFLGLLDARKKN